MSRRKPRHLKPDELELWRRVAKTTTPLDPVKAALSKAPIPDANNATPREPIPDFSIGQYAKDRNTRHAPASPTPPLRMDAKTFQRLQRGKGTPEARIDLHGMTAEEAKQRLTGFLLSAHARGVRLALVITGKGRARHDDGPIPTPDGVLRRELPIWLSRAPLSEIVLQSSPAHRRHGGSGAFYVYLARRRK